MAKKILVVDNALDTQTAIKQLLEESGYEVHITTDGMEGLKAARQICPNLIILNDMLPKMNGYKIARFLKFDDLYKHIPIIMLITLASESSLKSVLESGANTCLTNPYDPTILMEKVKELCP